MNTRSSDVLCGCCARTICGVGYSPDQNWKSKPPIFVCDDPQCLLLARESYNMKQDDFTRIESLAAGRGGEEGGAFLDQIGKTDLATMNEGEWFEFCRRIVAGYRKGLVHLIRTEAPF